MNDMTIGKAGNNWIYFTAHDQDEPTHAHANWPKKTEPGSAKIWVYKDGETMVQHQGHVSDKDMKVISAFLRQNYMVLFDKWETAFKVLRIYGEPDKEFTVASGELKVKEMNSFDFSTSFGDGNCKKTDTKTQGCTDNKEHYYCGTRYRSEIDIHSLIASLIRLMLLIIL